jgi:hypothetical protein
MLTPIDDDRCDIGDGQGLSSMSGMERAGRSGGEATNWKVDRPGREIVASRRVGPKVMGGENNRRDGS